MKYSFVGIHWDFIGFSASLACAVHCVVLPFLFTLAPLTGLQFLKNPWIEYAIILFGFFIASYALSHGYRKHHRKPQALMMVVAGFTLIGAGHLMEAEWPEILLTVLGAVAVAVAHLINWVQVRQSNTGLS